MQRTQGQTGQSPFGRYQGEQVSQFPPGYAEAMAAVGQAYASAGKSIAGGIQGAAEREDKLKELELQKGKLELEGKKDTTANRKLSIEENAKAAEGKRKDTEERRKTDMDLLTMTQNLHSEALKNHSNLTTELALDDAKKQGDATKLAPGQREQLKARILEAEGTKKQLFDRMVKLTNNFEQTRDVNQGLQGTSLNPSMLTDKGRQVFGEIGSPSYNAPNPMMSQGGANKLQNPFGAYQSGNIGQGSAGFKEAPATQGQRAGGNETQGQTSEQGTPTPAETPSGAQATEPVNPAEPVSGERSPLGGNKPANVSVTPDGVMVDKGDLGFSVFRQKSIKTSKDVEIPATIRFGADGKTANVVTGQGFDDKSPVAQERVRQAHLMKYILDNNMDADVTPSPEERAFVTANYLTKENAGQAGRIAAAYSVMNRNLNNDVNADDDFTSLVLTNRFKDKYRISPSDYLAAGQIQPEPVAPSPASGQNGNAYDALVANSSKLAQALTPISQQSSELNKKVDSEHDVEMDRINRLLKAEYTIQATNVGNESALTASKARTTNLTEQMRSLEVKKKEAEDKWAKQQELNNNLLKVQAELVASYGKENSERLLRDKFSMEQGKEVGEAERRFAETGVTSFEQMQALGGFMPILGTRVPDTTRFRYIETPSGQRALDRMDIREWTDYMSNHNPAALIRQAQMLPPLKNSEEAKRIQGKFDRLEQPINLLRQAYEHLEELKKTSIVAGEGSWMPDILRNAPERAFNPLLARASAARAKLVGEFREELIGPGNPSNFEQEIVRDVIPDPKEYFDKSSLGLEKLKGIASLMVSSHVASMRQQGFKPTAETLKQINDKYSAVLGKRLTYEELDKMASGWESIKKQYAGSNYVPGKQYAQQNATAGAFDAWTLFINGMTKK